MLAPHIIGAFLKKIWSHSREPAVAVRKRSSGGFSIASELSSFNFNSSFTFTRGILFACSRSQTATAGERCFLESSFSVVLLNSSEDFSTEMHFSRGKKKHANTPTPKTFGEMMAYEEYEAKQLLLPSRPLHENQYGHGSKENFLTSILNCGYLYGCRDLAFTHFGNGVELKI